MTLPGCRSLHPPLHYFPFREEDYKNLPVLGLATSLTHEYDYPAEIEGKIPVDLQGTLFRNGPGLFERGGMRKRCLLDGDGMVQAFRVSESQVHFQNRFVRTKKYREESAAGKFIYPTWSTQAPGGLFSNLGSGDFQNQAGITAVVRNGKLYAFDEFHPPHELDPATLETLGVSWLDLRETGTVISAHSKIDPRNGDWIFFGLEYSTKITLHLTVLAADDSLKMHRVFDLPRFTYIHDFFVSERHIILNLHPVNMRIWEFLIGRRSMVGAMQWKPDLGNLVLVFDRADGAGPIQLQTDASWMWHSLNAFDKGGEIIADFVGYRNPDHFLGEDPALCAIMQGRKGSYKYPGELRRYIIDPSAKRIREETLGSGDFEFPYVNPRHLCHPYRYGYLAKIFGKEHFFTGICRADMVSGNIQSFDFGPGVYCSEPVFVPLAEQIYPPETSREPGWVLTEVYDGRDKKSFLAIFDAEAIPSGPLARAKLFHHVPLGFHGFWQEGLK